MSLQAVVVMIAAAEERTRSFAVAAAETLAVEAGKVCGKLESKIAKLEKEVADLKAAKLEGVVSLRGRSNAA